MDSSCAQRIEGGRRHVLRAAVLGLLLTGCELSPTRPECHFGDEHTVARSSHRSLDAVALVATEAGAVALWSDPSGLYGRFVDRSGHAAGAATRIAERCTGGLAAEARGRSYTVVCLRPDTGGQGLPDAVGARPAVAVYTLDGQLKVRRSMLVGEAGMLSRGVSLARVGDGLGIVWLDAAAEHNRVWFVEVDAQGVAGSPRMISERGREAGVPDVVVHGSELRVVFREAFMRNGAPVAELVLWRPDAGRIKLLQLFHEHPNPRLARLSDQLYVVYRDRRRRGERVGLYVARFDGVGIARPGPRRVARADGDATPALSACFGGLVTSTPRTFAGDYFVGVSWLGAGPSAPTLEQQFYEDAHEFTDTAAACMGEHALLLIGERGRLAQKETTLRSATFACQ